MIPTAGAGRRSRRWLPRASTPAKEAQEAVQAGGGARWTRRRGRGCGEALRCCGLG